MTSANVVEYRIEDLNGKQAGKHYQSLLCKTHWGDLLKFTPAQNFTITAFGEDEEEIYWEDEPINLQVFIDNLKKNRAQFNTMDDILNKINKASNFKREYPPNFT